MAFGAKDTLRLMLVACLLAVGVSAPAAEQAATLSLQAVIANKGLGCDLTLPQTTLQFKPLSVSQLDGAVQTYQILPLPVQLHCEDEHEAIRPMLTVEGETPYPDDVDQTVFLSGTPNGVGFMLRQSAQDAPIPLTDFYQPATAIGQGGQGYSLTMLNDDNAYHSDTIVWVGLVGPFQPVIIPGHFHASLTLNVAFE